LPAANGVKSGKAQTDQCFPFCPTGGSGCDMRHFVRAAHRMRTQARHVQTQAADAADFDWHGFDEGDEVNGDGFVELQPDGSLEGEFAYDNGDESTLKARPW
jgi:hypothetical protein